MTMIMTDDERQALAQAVVREVVRELVMKPLAASIGSALHTPRQPEQNVTITQTEYDALQHFQRIYSQISSILACIAETEPVQPGDEITVQRLKWVILEYPGLLASVAQKAEPCRPDILERLTYHSLERDDLTLDDCLSYLAKGWYEVHGRTERQLVMQILALLAAAPEQPAPVPLTEPTEYTGVRCMCVLTGCQAGPGCPHYTEHCRKHIDHERAHGITKGDAS